MSGFAIDETLDIPDVGIKLITKEVHGLPWDDEIVVNYFRGVLTFYGKDYNCDRGWQTTEESAIKETFKWFAEELIARAKVIREYKGFGVQAYGSCSASNYRDYRQVRVPGNV